MEIIKFDLNEIKQKQDGFSYYILGRSYDLEEKMGSTFGIISMGILDVQSKPTIGQYIIDKLGEP